MRLSRLLKRNVAAFTTSLPRPDDDAIVNSSMSSSFVVEDGGATGKTATRGPTIMRRIEAVDAVDARVRDGRHPARMAGERNAERDDDDDDDDVGAAIDVDIAIAIATTTSERIATTTRRTSKFLLFFLLLLPLLLVVVIIVSAFPTIRLTMFHTVACTPAVVVQFLLPLFATELLAVARFHHFH